MFLSTWGRWHKGKLFEKLDIFQKHRFLVGRSSGEEEGYKVEEEEKQRSVLPLQSASHRLLDCGFVGEITGSYNLHKIIQNIYWNLYTIPLACGRTRVVYFDL